LMSMKLVSVAGTIPCASLPSGATGTVPFNVGNANTLFSNAQYSAFSELGGPNGPVGNNCGSFAWGLPFFYGKANGVFTAIEQQPVTGTVYVGPFWAY